ncbi:SymE family type I addiction module toxin [Chitinophaga defluvii]|uniref:SymE family type I addiction module toxin n=1 Tax=Chitinophaga defluvii TaxID=3163343 RepID=A0ABV2T4A2_9BACT
MRTIFRNAKLHSKAARRQERTVDVPWLNLSGHWLVKAGFNIGDDICIMVQHNYLRITKPGQVSKSDHPVKYKIK